MDCLTPALEFTVRRHWCLHPSLTIEALAADFGMTTQQLKAKLSYIENLRYRSLCRYGVRRLQLAQCRDARLVGFPATRLSHFEMLVEATDPSEWSD